MAASKAIAEKIINELLSFADKKQAENLARFFKTEKGNYGEGDKFLGVIVPLQRKIAKKYFREASLENIEILLDDSFHEIRLTAIFILIEQYRISDEKNKKAIYDFYLSHTSGINNWDIVDASAHKIIGDWLRDKNCQSLYKLARSKNLWERRIAIISTFAFIAEGDLDDAYKLSQILLKDKHSLIHKAVGWTLRECGKKDKTRLFEFIKNNGAKMSRVTLRYTIEKFQEKERKRILRETVKNNF